MEPPASPSYLSQQQQQQQTKHHYNYATNPQHFHHPGAVSPPPMNHSQLDNDTTAFPPPPPPLSTTISNMQTATHTFRSNPKLTANAVPRPYPGSPIASASGTNGGRLSQPSSPLTPTNHSNSSYQQNYETTSSLRTTNSQQQHTAAGSTAGGAAAATTSSGLHQVNRNLEACVQDLHDKTFGQGGVVQITSNHSYPGQNYEGYTSR